MITALVSSVLGIVGGLVPDIFKEIRDSREHGRELERMDRTAEIQLKMLDKQTDAKLAEIEAGVAMEEMRAFRAQMENIYKQQRPTGIRWVDGWNATLRPFAVTLTTLIFTFGASCIIYGVANELMAGRLGPYEAANAVLSGALGQFIEAVWGFLFGYRSARTVLSATGRK